MTLLVLWVGYAIVGVTMFTVMFVWAVRNGQFTDLERARYFALQAAEPIEKQPEKTPSRVDRYTWVGIVLITASMLGYMLCIAMRYR